MKSSWRRSVGIWGGFIALVWLAWRAASPSVDPNPDPAPAGLSTLAPRPAPAVASTASPVLPPSAQAQSWSPSPPARLPQRPIPVSNPGLTRGTSRVLPTTEEAWRQRPKEPALGQFHDWALAYQQANPRDRPGRLAQGVELAQARRREVRELIETDPARVFAVAVPDAVRAILPDAVASELEVRVQGVGELAVRSASRSGSDGPGACQVERDVFFPDRRYQAFVSGDRLVQPTLRDVPLWGWVLEGRMAVAESAVRLLDSSEATVPADAVCVVTGLMASAHGMPLAAAVGEEIVTLCGTTAAEELHERQVRAAFAANQGDEVTHQPRRAYTEGTKRLIFIRVDFSDLPGLPFNDSLGTNMLSGLNAFFREQSYGKLGFQRFGSGSAMTPLLRLTNTAAYYGARDASDVRTAARAAAVKAGYTLSNYDFDLICFGSVPGFSWAGLGYIGAPGAWIRSAFDASAGVVAHELGHNLGLYHANYWDTAGTSVTGDGTSVEYGDSFDTMGTASGGSRHFSTRAKNYLDWLPFTYVKAVTATSTNRLFAMDSTNANTSVRALTVRYNTRTNYWLELRQKLTSNRWAQDGIGLRWGRTDASPTLLLDTTPGSSEGKNDSAIVVGRTYTDRRLGVHITPLARGGTDPAWVDVAVFFGQPTNDLPPQVVVTSSTASAGINSVVTFTANATDPDDPAVAYAWDYGDGTFGPNAGLVAKAYNTAGEYVVRCTVSDLRGKTASDSVVVRVGNPSTVRISGRVTREGQPLEGVRVSVSNTRQVFTDSDGGYILAGLTRGTYSLKAEAEGLLFLHPAFTNPLNLQANRTGLDFEGSLPGDLYQLTVVPLGAEWRYLDRGMAPTVLWKTLGFDDSTWSRGAAQLGYGDEDVVTTVGFGSSAAQKHITTWFRHRFVVEDPKAYLSATLGLIRDDGAAVYLNGKEVFRSNLPTGTLTATTLASSTVGGTDESTLFETDLDPAQLLKGENILAVELHQSTADSSDLSFALQLRALMYPLKDPRLEIGRVGELVRFSWSVAAVGFELEEALAVGGPWMAVDATVQTSSGLSYVEVPLNEGVRCYRLIRR
jgi:hypothetical protein